MRGCSLHRKMDAQLRMTLGRVSQKSDVGENHGVCAHPRRVIDSAMPKLQIAGAREGVDGDQHFGVVRVRVGYPFAHLRPAEVETREVARIGLVAEAAVDAVGTGVHRRTKGRGRSGRADDLEGSPVASH